MSDKIISILIISIYSFQSSIFNSIFTIFACTKLDNNTSFIKAYMTESCSADNPRYQMWSNYISIPILIVYSVVLPLMLFILTSCHRHNIYDATSIRYLSFLVRGYKKDKFYW